MKHKILIIDDERNILVVLQAILEREGYEVIAVGQSVLAKERIRLEKPSLVITDLYMPQVDGMAVLELCQKMDPELPVVMVTAFGTVEAAVAALKRGAFDFISKPFDQSELLAVVKKALETRRLRQNETQLSRLSGSSPAMKEVLRVISKIARSPSTVLISGESGTGKELVALEIHQNSDRADKPFVRINCAAIPATLIESEFFGYEKGAFTGAVTSKPGRFELAHEGTLFLDEVGDMGLEMQVKLLRAIQEQEFERVGGVSPIKVDVRIVAATNRDLAAEVKAGRFREDLYYRLNVVPIDLPPLRERKEDFEPLVLTFIQQFNQKFSKSIEGLETECWESLRAYTWPGNIRQLENALERMTLMSEGPVLRLQDLPPEIPRCNAAPAEVMIEDAGTDFKTLVKRHSETYERSLIEKALDETGGNVTRAAERLGLSRKGLQLKMRELGLRRPDLNE